MDAEIEAKFLDIDHDDMRLRRKNNGWARVRDEGSRITMSYKQLDDRSFQGTKEVSLVIDNFKQGCAFMGALGLQQISYQETKRESWKLGDVEIDLDEWPWAKPYMEIEGKSEEAVRSVAQQLGLDWSRVMHGSVEVVYMAEYDVIEEEINSWPKILFTDVPTDIQKRRKAKAVS